MTNQGEGNITANPYKRFFTFATFTCAPLFLRTCNVYLLIFFFKKGGFLMIFKYFALLEPKRK